MAPRKNKSKKKVMSLADFNPDAALGRTEPELMALPSAPKNAEEWDAVGGRPEYNSRGFKERTVTTKYDDGIVDDEEFMQRDWTRTGPLDDADDASGPGRGPGERNWEGMRRGPLDDGGDGQERNWDSMRRGPLDAELPSGVERNWDDMRRGPIEALGSVAKDVDFMTARRGPVEAEFESRGAEVDFTQRRGPVDADFGESRGEVDFSNRRGPIEAEFETKAEVDFSTRRGPVEAQFESSGVREVDFAVRAGPVEAETPETRREPDLAAARRSGGVVEAATQKTTPPVERDFGSIRRSSMSVEAAATKQTSELDFGNARRAVRVSDAGTSNESTPVKDAGPATSPVVDWNVRKGPVDAIVPRSRHDDASRAMHGYGATRQAKYSQQGDRDAGGTDSPKSEGPGEKVWDRNSSSSKSYVNASVGQSLASDGPKERDWGRARMGQPLPARSDVSRPEPTSEIGNTLARASLADSQGSTDAASGDTKTEGSEDSGDWTTVRSHVRRSGPYSRGRGGRGGYSQRGRPARLVPAGGHSHGVSASSSDRQSGTSSVSRSAIVTNSTAPPSAVPAPGSK